MEIKPTRNLKNDLNSIRYLNLFRLLLGVFFLFFYFNKADSLVGLSYIQKNSLTQFLVGFFFIYSVLVWVASSYFKKKNILIGLIALAIDLPVIILLTLLFDGVHAGWAILPVITIGSFAMLSRRPYAILAMPIAASILLWSLSKLLLSDVQSFPSSSILLYSLIYFAIALVGIRQSQNYHQTLLITQSQKKKIIDLSLLSKQVIDQLHYGVIAFDKDYQVVLINNKAQEITKISRKSLLPTYIIKKIIAARDTQSRNMVIRGEDIIYHVERAVGQSDLSLLFLETQRQINEKSQQSNLATIGQLSATVAHELRNPMASIYSAAQLLQESENLDESDKSLAAIISKHIERSNQIIEDILLMSKPHIPQTSKIVLFDFLNKFKQDFINKEQKDNVFGIVIEPIDKKLSVHFDSNHLNQILWNLTNNAIKHGSDGNVTITISNLADYVLIDVKNNGDKLEPIVEESLFIPFFTTHTQGTGLGLYICREMCKSNNAKLEYLRLEFQHVFRLHISK